ncbi:MAG: hypothetical protein ABI155_16070 [Paralcaligenes sp.]
MSNIIVHDMRPSSRSGLPFYDNTIEVMLIGAIAKGILTNSAFWQVNVYMSARGEFGQSITIDSIKFDTLTSIASFRTSLTRAVIDA